ncbi:ZIP family metal transporter [Longimonas halophila]|uniref:ZIP family metal transporter n=1 Tax=Longimonas halophila TaxID=1469170 RepID=A0A2H3P4X0_9BACT|nr:ZIP family metal transporter [Longimonas halophila]PEN05646.1 ZIP family metal transporter [Longimonas halophila]
MDVSALLGFLESLSPVAQALVAGLLTWVATAVGAAFVFSARTVNRRFLDTMLGFAAGVMIAASIWSLIEPSIRMAEAQDMIVWLPAAVGVLLGGGVLRLADALIPHLHSGAPLSEAEGPSTSWQRVTLLVVAITLHNIPEGLAIGVAFGAAATDSGIAVGATVAGAVALTIGICLQNLPEGMAVSLPIRGEGYSRLRSFGYGQLSGLVYPFATVAGATTTLLIRPLLPYALAFAAGAMLYVVIEELIPESHRHGHADPATMGALVGFTVMMVLDVALG